jgi:orotate phosphoribosyltransferase
MSAALGNTAEVIDFLVQSGALRFGDFTLKSGRKAPYFINTGSFDDGLKISKLAKFYAQRIVDLNLGSVDAVFGPAYKGVPLCVSTAMSLSQNFGIPMGFCFNRKEAKTRGEGGEFVGKPLRQGMKLVLVEDVVTAGTTFKEVIPLVRSHGAEVSGVIILVDRDEKGADSISAVKEAERDLDIRVSPIVNINQIITYLSGPNSSGLQLDDDLKTRIAAYRKEFGAS